MKIYKHLTANAINLTPFDFARELSMEAYLLENPLVLSLDSKGYDEIEIIEDEITIKSGRASKKTDGRIDLVGYYDSSNTLAVIELKKGTIGTENIEQLHDYLMQKDQILKSITEKNSEIEDPKWIGILVGTSISNDLMNFIQEGKTFEVNGNQIPLAALTIRRYKSDDGQFFISTESYHNTKQSNKDFSKYEFNGNTYGKGKLVRAVIQDYAQRKPNATFVDVKSVFPDSLGQSWGVFISKKEADIINAKGHIRYFTKPDEIIKLSDETIAVSSQWGLFNIVQIIKIFKKLGIKIKEVTY